MKTDEELLQELEQINRALMFFNRIAQNRKCVESAIGAIKQLKTDRKRILNVLRVRKHRKREKTCLDKNDNQM